MYDSFSEGHIYFGRTTLVILAALALSVLAHLI